MKRLLRILADPLTVFLALPWLMVILIAGTVAQKYIGLDAACAEFFSSFILWIGPLPLPGGYIVIGFIGLCLLIKFLFYSAWQRKRAGVIIAHFGVIVLLIGAALTAAFSQEGLLIIREHQSSSVIIDKYSGKERALPFTLSLTQVRKDTYPGTDKALEYESRLIIQDGDVRRSAVISMNAPLRYRGYTFYQSSYREHDNTRESVLAVVHNVGRLFPYISISLITFGLVLHIFLYALQKIRKKP